MKTSLSSNTCFKVLSALFISIILISCNQNNQQNISSTFGPHDEATKFAKTLYGENVNLPLRGDNNANSKPDALAIVVNKQIDDLKFWILKGGIIEKEESG